jgi:group I intron endonuclease
MAHIYKITNPKEEVYIGQTIDLKGRMHRYSTVSKSSLGRSIYNSLKKYGWDNHTFDVIEVCEENKLNERERFWIKKFNSFNKGLNLTEGGSSGRHNHETCLKKSKSMTGKTHSKETRQKMSDTKKNHPMYTKEWKDKMRKGAWSSKTSAKPILQFDKEHNLIKEWESSRKAARELGLHIGPLSSALNGKYHTCGGFVWKFKE